MLTVGRKKDEINHFTRTREKVAVNKQRGKTNRLVLFFSFAPKRRKAGCPSTSARNHRRKFVLLLAEGGRRKEEKNIIADCVQEALGIFSPIVLCNPYVNSTLC